MARCHQNRQFCLYFSLAALLFGCFSFFFLEGRNSKRVTYLLAPSAAYRMEPSNSHSTYTIWQGAALIFIFFFCLALSNRVIVTDGSFSVCVTFSQEYFVHSLLNVAGVVPFFFPPSDR